MTDASSARPRRRRFGPIAVLVIVIGLASAFHLPGRALDVVFNPWAHPSRGKTLTGTWVAPLTLPSGLHAAVYLDVRRAIYHTGRRKGRYAGGGKRTPNIEGAGRWCDENGLRVPYRLSGRMSSYSHELGLGFEPPAPGVVPVRGLIVTAFEGRWLESDTLRLAMKLSRQSQQGISWSSADPDLAEPVPILFHRGTTADFERACPRGT